MSPDFPVFHTVKSAKFPINSKVPKLPLQTYAVCVIDRTQPVRWWSNITALPIHYGVRCNVNHKIVLSSM